jgi:hypothetical protein
MKRDPQSPQGPRKETVTEALADLERLIHAPVHALESLIAAARHPALNEELALALLQRRDLDHTVLEALGRNQRAMKLRKVRTAVVAHPRTPRHVSLPQLRHLFTFDLMRLALLPQVPADLKMAADELLVTRLPSLTAGERLSLARQGSGRIAAQLLLDSDARTMEAALDNSRLTETLLIRSLGRSSSTRALAESTCRHPRWSLQREVRAALLRHPGTPIAYAIGFTESFTVRNLEDILERSELPDNMKFYLMRIAERRRSGKEPVGP